MTTFRELCEGKMSNALQAMVDGLRRQDARDDFVVDMSDWLEADARRCFGCAASCVVQELTGTNFTAAQFIGARPFSRPSAVESIGPNRRCDVLRVVDRVDLDAFECAIDSARLGDLDELAVYMDCGDEFVEADGFNRWRDRFCLGTNDWREQLGQVEDVIQELRELGL